MRIRCAVGGAAGFELDAIPGEAEGVVRRAHRAASGDM